MKCSLDELTRIDFSEVWDGGEVEFSDWLSQKDNISKLCESLEIEPVYNTVLESRVGKFRADIYGETEDGKGVVIENQLGESNHKHLGQIITYIAGKDASIVIWIVENARPEHRAAFNWLNNNIENRWFYLVELRLVKIGDSLPAPVFDPVEKPNEYTRMQNDNSETESFNYNFWSEFLDFIDDDKDIGRLFYNSGNLNPSTKKALLFRPCKSYHLEPVTHTKNNSVTDIFCDIVTDSRYFDSILAVKDLVGRDIGIEPVGSYKEGQTKQSIRYPGPDVNGDSKKAYVWFRKTLVDLQTSLNRHLV